MPNEPITTPIHFPILINGVKTSHIYVMDRGLLYGDGLFTTLAVKRGKPILLDRHLARLETDSKKLRLSLDLSLVIEEIHLLLKGFYEDAVLRITVTRGEGQRGYRIPVETTTTRILSLNPFPTVHVPEKGINLRVCDTRLSRQPRLCGIKHLNRLEQVIARSEWSDPFFHEGLMFDDNDLLIEGTMSNVFLAFDMSSIITPRLQECGIKGVMREEVIHLAKQRGVDVYEEEISRHDLVKAKEIFMTNSIIGVWPAQTCLIGENSHLKFTPHWGLEFRKMIQELMQ
ncbi:MAG: aminodeoxychorismate lyase [Pseudomonadota bacterium]